MAKEDSTCPSCGSEKAYIPLFSGNIKCINKKCNHYDAQHRQDELGDVLKGKIRIKGRLEKFELDLPGSEEVIDCDFEGDDDTPVIPYGSPTNLPKGIVNKLCVDCKNYTAGDPSYGVCNLKTLVRSPKDSCQDFVSITYKAIYTGRDIQPTFPWEKKEEENE